MWKIWINCKVVYCKLFEPKAPHQQLVNDVKNQNSTKVFTFPFSLQGRIIPPVHLRTETEFSPLSRLQYHSRWPIPSNKEVIRRKEWQIITIKNQPFPGLLKSLLWARIILINYRTLLKPAFVPQRDCSRRSGQLQWWGYSLYMSTITAHWRHS